MKQLSRKWMIGIRLGEENPDISSLLESCSDAEVVVLCPSTYSMPDTNIPHRKWISYSDETGHGEQINLGLRYALFREIDYFILSEKPYAFYPDKVAALIHQADGSPELGVIFSEDQTPGLNGKQLSAGGICLIRMDCVRKAGLLDPSYYLFYDTADWLCRIQKAGFKFNENFQFDTLKLPESMDQTDTYYCFRNGLYFSKRFQLTRQYRSYWVQVLKSLHLTGARWALIDFVRGKRGRRTFESFGSFLKRKIQSLMFGLTQILRLILKKMTGGTRHILIQLNWNLGDEIMCIPVYEALVKKYQKAKVYAQVRFPDLLTGNPYVKALSPQEQISFDKIINLRREVQGQTRNQYLTSLTGLPILKNPEIIIEEAEVLRVYQSKQLDPKRPWIALSRGAKWFSRQWPEDKWMEVIHYLERRWSTGIMVLGQGDEGLPAGVDLVNRTTPREAAALLKLCRLFVGCDSGLLHLALSVGTSAVGLYGPLNPDYLVSSRPGFIPVYSPVECRGCWSHARMKYPDHCPKVDFDCMKSISAAKVTEACDLLLSSNISGNLSSRITMESSR